MLFLQVSFDEYTGNHHTNTFFFDFRKWVISNLKDKLSIHKSSSTSAHYNLLFFFGPFNALQWHKADVIIPDT